MSYQRFISNMGFKPTKRTNIGFEYQPFSASPYEKTPGQSLADDMSDRMGGGVSIYNQMRNNQSNRVAQDIVGKSAFQVPTDEFGLVDQKLTDFRPAFTSQLKATTQRGQLALQTEEAKSNWQKAKDIQDLGGYEFTGEIGVGNQPGSNGEGPGARAVALAMQAYNNKTPYIWGGNSLTRGVDCSGLVQQVYKQLGITLPRVTYDQAKHGKQVSMNQIRPGDLIFYNLPGDPLGHVGIYMGNDQIVHAANPKIGIVVGKLYGSNGPPVRAIRPY